MSAVTALTIVLIIAATAACLALVWATRELVMTARSLRLLTDETRERLIPMLDKADITIDATNAELLRIDGAITRFEEASVRVSAATGTLSEIVQAPEKIVNGVADRMRRAWKDRRRQHPAEEAPSEHDIAEEPIESSEESEDDFDAPTQMPADAAPPEEPANVENRPED